MGAGGLEHVAAGDEAVAGEAPENTINIICENEVSLSPNLTSRPRSSGMSWGWSGTAGR